MREPILVRSGGGEVVGDAPDRRVEILSDDETLNATWSRFGPRRDGADLHVHRHHTDLFYVLDGELTVMLGIDGQDVAVPRRTLARVPPLVVHGFRNGSDGEVRYLNFHAPGRRFADYLRAVRDGREFSYDQHPPPADGGRSPADAAVGAEPFVADRAGVRLALLADVDEIAIAEVRCDSGVGLRPHVHRRHVESLYVLDGDLHVAAGERELRATRGSWLQLPPGVGHALAAGTDGASYLEVHTPSCGFGAYVRGDAGEQAAAFDQAPA